MDRALGRLADVNTRVAALVDARRPSTRRSSAPSSRTTRSSVPAVLRSRPSSPSSPWPGRRSPRCPRRRRRRAQRPHRARRAGHVRRPGRDLASPVAVSRPRGAAVRFRRHAGRRLRRSDRLSRRAAAVHAVSRPQDAHGDSLRRRRQLVADGIAAHPRQHRRRDGALVRARLRRPARSPAHHRAWR